MMANSIYFWLQSPSSTTKANWSSLANEIYIDDEALEGSGETS